MEIETLLNDVINWTDYFFMHALSLCLIKSLFSLNDIYYLGVLRLPKLFPIVIIL